MTSCMELWFPTSAPASHRRHFFLLRSLSLALFLLISSRIVLLFFFIFYFYFFLYISRRYYAAKMIEFRCVALVAQLKPTHDAATAFEKRNFQELLFVTCSVNATIQKRNTRFLLSLLFNDIAFVSFFFPLFLRFFLTFCCNWFDTLRICDEMFRLDSKEEVFLE